MSPLTQSHERRAADDHRTALEVIAQAASAVEELTRRLPTDIDLVGVYIPGPVMGILRHQELDIHAKTVQDALRVIEATGEIFTHTLGADPYGVHHDWYGHWRGLLVAVTATWKAPAEMAP